MKRIALKIDVDTCRGTQTGVPALIDLLQRHQARASFFLALGPDRSGHAPQKESLKQFYDRTTRLYGRILKGPTIGVQGMDAMQQIASAGFEVGLHGWDRAEWEMRINESENTWIEGEMCKAFARFEQIFLAPPKAHAAPGWRMNRHALRLTQRLGFTYASDCRGESPFIPVIDGEIIRCPQIPTTLPTLDEIMAVETNINPEQAMERIQQLSEAIPGDHVFTLRAELEGMKYLAAFDWLLAQWKSNDVELVGLNDLAATLVIGDLPRHIVEMKEVSGRAGKRLTQGDVFLQ